MGVLFSRNLRSSATLDTSKSSYASGKNVLITGASAGIGAELARKFAEQGANLALVARNQNNLEAVAKECLELGAIKAEVFPCDLTRDEDTKTAIQNATESFGNFDIVILNAGRSMGCYFEEIRDMESINYMLKLNVNGVIHALLCALPAIPKSEASRIVIVSSVAGLIGVPYRTIYCASKHALAGFANALRIELRDTYGGSANNGNGAPRVQLINFPEVQGTNLNTGRMDMGAVRPPVEFKTGVGVVTTVEKACLDLLLEIEKGIDEWGQSPKFQILVLLRLFFTTLVDFLILNGVKKSHIRPVEQPGSAVDDTKKSQ
jgi:NADP-dependent 3-hydroxy acid dehydrogenase YdfG